MWPSSARLFSISFDLQKVDKVRELVEQFKEIGIVPMRIIPEFVSLPELQIELASFIVLLPNLVFLGIGIAFSFNFFDSLVFIYGVSLGTYFIELSFLHSSLSLHSSFLSYGELLGKFLMLHHMPFFSR